MARYLIRATTIVPKTVVVLPEGQTVVAGATVDLPESYGDHLVAELLAIRASDAVEAEPVTGDDDDDLTREEIVAVAIDGLDDDGFTDGGKPKVDAINEAMPEGAEPVTGDERDAVWDAMLRDRAAAT